ncbi:hypothetical protein KIH41_02565 [Litoribacter ruber]|uniref:hypothetical protein n=1 Tax=Litoribacter ruber TaxID=702568 RepID=UPI001BDAE8E0|nr:hypothetical protein [Litoribacter ruber]MBT0810163.1 hypothetical protein [Litoribacter ruber]
MKQLFEIETDNSEILDKFRELARKHNASFKEWKLANDENPSPSGDPYFENPNNIKSILEGIKEAKEGKTVKLTKEERKKLLGL